MSGAARRGRLDRTILAAVFALVVVANLALRDFRWRYEWTWAFFNLGFVTVLLCPLAAAVGATSGAGFRDCSRTLAVSSGRIRAAVLADIWSIVALLWAAYALGLAITVAIVAASTGGTPSANTLLTLPGPLLQLAAAAAVGWLVGYGIARWWSGAVMAASWFIVTLGLYINGPEGLVRTGGASASLVGLKITPTYFSRQTLFLLVVLCVALGLAVHSSDRANLRPSLAIVAAAVVLGTGLVASAGRPQPFAESKVSLVCDTETPRICVAAEYQALLPQARRSFDKALKWWADLGGPQPIEAVQRVWPKDDGRITVSTNYLDPEDFGGKLVHLLFDEEQCDFHEIGSASYRAWMELNDVARLQLTEDPERLANMRLSYPIGRLSNEEIRLVALRHIETVRSDCNKPG